MREAVATSRALRVVGEEGAICRAPSRRPLLLLESEESAVEQGKYGVVVVRAEFCRVQ